MKLRDQRPNRPDHTAYTPPGWTENVRTSTPTLTLGEVTGGVYEAREFAVGLAVPNCAKAISWDADAITVWLYSLPPTTASTGAAAEGTGLSVAAATFPHHPEDSQPRRSGRPGRAACGTKSKSRTPGGPVSASPRSTTSA